MNINNNILQDNNNNKIIPFFKLHLTLKKLFEGNIALLLNKSTRPVSPVCDAVQHPVPDTLPCQINGAGANRPVPPLNEDAGRKDWMHGILPFNRIRCPEGGVHGSVPEEVNNISLFYLPGTGPGFEEKANQFQDRAVRTKILAFVVNNLKLYNYSYSSARFAQGKVFTEHQGTTRLPEVPKPNTVSLPGVLLREKFLPLQNGGKDQGFGSGVAPRNFDLNINNKESLKNYNSINSNSAEFYETKPGNFNEKDKSGTVAFRYTWSSAGARAGKFKRNKLILNQYLKTMSTSNMRKKGILMTYNNQIEYSFVTGDLVYNNKLISKIYKLLQASFKSMYCLISKPVFVITPEKINIRLFYFLFIPNILKFKKNKRHLAKGKIDLIKKQYIKFKKIKKNIKIKLRDLSNIALTKVFANKFKILSSIISKLFKKPVEFDLIRLHYPYNDSNILVNLLGVMVNKIKLRVIVRRLFEKAVIMQKKVSGSGAFARKNI